MKWYEKHVNLIKDLVTKLFKNLKFNMRDLNERETSAVINISGASKAFLN